MQGFNCMTECANEWIITVYQLIEMWIYRFDGTISVLTEYNFGLVAKGCTMGEIECLSLMWAK